MQQTVQMTHTLDPELMARYESAVKKASIIDTGVITLRERLNSAIRQQNNLLTAKKRHEETLDKVPVAHELLQSLYEQTSGPLIKSCEEAITSSVRMVIDDKSEIGIDAEISNNQIRVNLGTAQRMKDGTRVLRDIMDDEGGGLTNVVTTTLRIISMIRSRQRRFIILDEPNCWLNPAQIPAFSRMIQDIADRAGFQIILLTHHGMEHFDNDINVINLKHDEEGKIVVTASHPGQKDDGHIVTSIHLQNFGGHEDLNIPLSGGLNVITGRSNIGKSRIMAAMRAVVMGTGYAGNISTVEDENGFLVMEKMATVSVTFDNGKLITWTRKKSGSPIEQWSLSIPGVTGVIEHEGIVCSGKNGKQWVGKVLNLFEVGGLMPSLHMQKNAVFGIDDKKALASLISVSETSIKLQSMIAVVAEKKKIANAEIRRINNELLELSVFIHTLDSQLEALVEDVADTSRLKEDIQVQSDNLRELCHAYEQDRIQSEAIKRNKAIAELYLASPVLVDTQSIVDALIEYENLEFSIWQNRNIASLKNEEHVEIEKTLARNVELSSEYERYLQVEESIHRHKRIAALALPNLNLVDTQSMADAFYTYQALEQKIRREKSIAALGGLKAPQLVDTKSAYEAYLEYQKLLNKLDKERRIMALYSDTGEDILKQHHRLVSMTDSFEQYRALEKKRMVSEQEHAEILSRVSGVESEIAALRQSIEICPLCGTVCRHGSGES